MSYISFESFLGAIYDTCPAKAESLWGSYRIVEHGLLSVGLKLHDLTGGEYLMPLVERLGGKESVLESNHYRRTQEAVCLVLPPVGNADSAILFIECIEHYIGKPLFRNPKIQIQVCSPGRLSNLDAGLLTLGFYLGSDIIRLYSLDDLETTFTENKYIPRGKRITIYDGMGKLDNNFEWWMGRLGAYRQIKPHIPLKNQRTDVLTATTRKDIRNINLMATLLVHLKYGAYWARLGYQFRKNMTDLLREHLLQDLLSAQWVLDDEQHHEDEQYLDAIRQIRAYVVGEVKRLHNAGKHSGILHSVNVMLEKFRSQIVRESLETRGDFI